MKNYSLKTQILSFIITTTMTFSLSGCRKDKENNDNPIGYNLISEQNNDNKANGIYSYLLNCDGFVCEKYDFPTSIQLSKVIEKEEYGTKLSNARTASFYRDNIKIVWPDCFSNYGNAWFDTDNFNFDIIVEKLNSFNGVDNIIVVRSSMTAKRNLNNSINYMYTNGQLPIEKGDNLSSIAIYYDNELIAFKQTGVGSDSQNVLDATIGNVDLALKEVKDEFNLSTTQNVTKDELNEILKNINEKSKENTKMLIK